MKNLILCITGSFLLFACYTATAQSPGLIIRPAGGNGITALNPDGNAYSSLTTAGFLLDDISESKIPFKIVPPAINEPTGDLATGPSGGFTDIVQRVDGSGFYLYKNATNIFFRLRIGNIISGSKGYSVLIDTDGKIGTADPNYVAPSGGKPGNPGFEYEVVLETNFQVAVYSIDGTSTPGAPVTYPLASNSQISVALSTDGNNPDYFYDWYIPMSAIGNPSSVRLAITTVTSPSSSLQGSRSDIYGINDASFSSTAAAWITAVNAQASINLSSFGTIDPVCTAAPVLTGSVATGVNVTVSGSWTRMESSKPSLAIVTLYKNGVSTGTTSVTSGNNWSIIVPVVANGDVFYAKAQALGESQCLSSNSLTASACTVLPAAPVLTCASLKGISGTMPSTASGNTVVIYQLPTTAASPFSAPVSTISNLTYPDFTHFAFHTNGCSGGTNNVAAGTYMIVTQNGSCTSAPTFVCVTSGSTGTPPAPSTNGISLSLLYPTSSTVNGTGATTGEILRLFVNGVYHSSITATGSSFSFTGVTLKTGDDVKVYVQSGGCITQSTTFAVNCQLEAPSIKLNATGNLLSGESLIEGISSTGGASVQLYKGTYPSGVAVGSPVTASSSGAWSVSVPSLISGEVYYAVQTSGGCTSTASSAASVLTAAVCPVISGTYSDISNTVTGTMPSSFTGTIRLYVDDVQVGSQSVTASTSWSITLPANTLYYNGILKATAQAAGTAESKGCSGLTIGCTSPALPNATPLTASIAPGSTITYGISNVAPNAWYSLTDNTGLSFALSLLNSGSTSFNLTSKAFTVPGQYNLKISADALTGCPSSSRAVSLNVNLTLPLTLLNFGGEYKQNASHFNWSTSNEVNTSHFELERSTDGTDFTTAAIILFIDNNRTVESFDYTIPGQLINPAYFRLKIVDNNGNFQYSKTILLKPQPDKAGIISVTPNPFMDQLTICYTTENKTEIACTITNVAGRIVHASRRQIAKGTNLLSLQQLSSLPAGIYFLSVQDKQTGITTMHKIQKTN